MAEAGVSFLADNLRQLIIQGADRLKPVEDEVRDIEEQLHELEAVIKDQSMNSSGKHLEKIISEKIRPIIEDAEDSINTYISIVSERAKKGGVKKGGVKKGAVIRSIIYSVRQDESAEKLRTLKSNIQAAIKELRSHRPLTEATDQSHVPCPAGQVEEELLEETTVGK